jgi:hypothetical protein
MFFSPKKRPCPTRTGGRCSVCWVMAAARLARRATASLAEPRRAERDAGPGGARKKIDFFAARNRVTRNRRQTRNRGQTRNRFSPGPVRFTVKKQESSWRAVGAGQDFLVRSDCGSADDCGSPDCGCRLRVTRLRVSIAGHPIAGRNGMFATSPQLNGSMNSRDIRRRQSDDNCL